MRSKTITILGATGSIGDSAAKVIGSAPERFEVQTLTAYRNVEKLAARARELNVKKAIIADENLYTALYEALLGTGIECAAGEDAIIEAAAEQADIVLCAIVGVVGLKPVMAALESGNNIAIANKEPLVAAGQVVMPLAAEKGAHILPVDSEHNAIFQVFEKENRDTIERLILTASGGPFLKLSRDEMKNVNPEQALKHPNWVMGQKISIDSATMMNKALEIVEAHYLFDMPADKIDVLIHPQSAMHSMVEYNDGSIKAELGASDMCTPIANALAWPERMATPGDKLDFTAIGALEFHRPDPAQFPCLQFAYDALKAGPGACIALNAANEIAVDAFLKKRIGFLDIEKTIAHALDQNWDHKTDSLEVIAALDQDVRKASEEFLMSISK